MVSTGTVRCLALGCLLTACGSPTGPHHEYQLPAPDLSLDPAQLTVGDRIAPTCTDLSHLEGTREWALVDVFFGRGPGGDDAWDGPTPADKQLVTSNGGRVLYEFNVPAVRARILLSRIPKLVQDAGEDITVFDVPDPTRYDVPSVYVDFEEPYPLHMDTQPLSLVGGSLIHVRFQPVQGVRGFRAVIPDRSIPEVREWPNVARVYIGTGINCVA